ncbi:hypothetical protein GT755_18160 [Herbidospora sp. NEAU-GS84]|uniref:Uncharacterized protein n=1 Tax=Herbidospora solisilvae TaxID=2696284 RepID=A0A7C9MY09_9ACTN|nr:hypothetical protein [Herbidospora solisilvae]NAS23611.1 hypothetical protein [Herbidospora solisilvae]
MDRDEAAAVLRAAEAHRETVRAAGRWPVTVLLALGGVLFATEFTTAFTSGAWTFLPAAWAAICAAWVGWYASRQSVRPRGYLRRYSVSLVAGMLLHVGYVLVLVLAGWHGEPLVALVGAAAVAAPFFVGAHVESRAA